MRPFSSSVPVILTRPGLSSSPKGMVARKAKDLPRATQPPRGPQEDLSVCFQCSQLTPVPPQRPTETEREVPRTETCSLYQLYAVP